MFFVVVFDFLFHLNRCVSTYRMRQKIILNYAGQVNFKKWLVKLARQQLTAMPWLPV